MPDNREHWPTMSRREVADRLCVLGLPEDRARRMEHRAAVRLWRRLEDRNERLTNCSAEALVEDMVRHGVEVVKVGGPSGSWKLKPNGVTGERWIEGILPTLRMRKEEIVDAYFARMLVKPAFEACVKCLAEVYEPEDAGRTCEFILSCPYLPKEPS